MKQAKLLQKGIALRKQGHSFREISEILGISKSTASLWLRNVKMSLAGKARLKQISDDGREKGKKTTRGKRIAAWQVMAKKTIDFKKSLVDYNINRCKIILAMLYWGEGAKTTKRLDFINSDPTMIKTYLFLLRKSFTINEDKLKATLHLHEYHNQQAMIDFWSKITKISKQNFHIYRKENTGKRKKEGYQGCLSLRYCNVNIFNEVMLIIDRFQKAIQ